jgi:hypothetical protein
MAAAPPPPASSPRLVQRETTEHGGRGDPNQAGQTSGSLALAEPATPLPASVVVETEATLLLRELILRVRKVKPAVAATLELAAPIAVTRERIVLGFEHDSFEDGRAGEMDARDVLTAEAQQFFGAETSVSFEVAARGSKLASVAYLDAAKRKLAVQEARASVEKHRLVQKALEIFDAELKDIKLPPQED